MKKILVASLVGLCILSVVSMVLLLRAWKRSEKLLAESSPPPALPSPNAFDFYIAAANSVRQPELIQELYKSPRLPSEPGFSLKLEEKAEIVRVNASALERLRGGFRHAYWEPLRPFSFEEEDLGPLEEIRPLIRLLSLEGQLKAARGDWDGAAQSNLDAIRVGTDVHQGGPILSQLNGIACQAIGRKPLWDVLERLDAPQSRTVVKRLEALDARSVPFAKTLENEKRSVQSSFREIIRDPKIIMDEAVKVREKSGESDKLPPGALGFGTMLARLLSRKSLIHYSDYMDRYIARAKQPYAFPLPRPDQPNDAMASQMVSLIDEIWIKERDNVAQNRLLMLAVALRAYRLEHDRYPDTLNQLVPSYLSRVPEDPFALRKPVGYRPDKSSYRLYSIGPDGRDDGGIPIDDPRKAKTGRKAFTARYFVKKGSKGDIVAGVNP